MRWILLVWSVMLSSCATCPLMQGTQLDAGTRIAKTAEKWVGKSYRPGKPRQCANFVAEVVKEAGVTALPKNAPMARSWLAWGRSVPLSQSRPGDVVVLWRGSPRGRAGHILVVTGKDEAVHRSTYRAPVQRVSLSAYRGKVLGVRRAT